MAKAAEQFRASDVTVWGFIALGVWAFAILAGNLSALLPSGLYTALHASRLDGGTMNQLRTQVAALEAEAGRLRNDTIQLTQRFTMGEDNANSLTRRVAAMEVSLPKITEAQAAAAAALPALVDATVTGAIGKTASIIDDTVTGDIDSSEPVPLDEAKPMTFETEGGSVSVTTVPLIPVAKTPIVPPKPLADLGASNIVADGHLPGVVLGPPMAASEATATWQGYLAAAGTMLVGLSPVLGDTDANGLRHIVAGPILDATSAADLCKRLDSAGIPCSVAPFSGAPMAAAKAAQN